MSRPRARNGDRGSVSVELAILAVPLLLLFSVLIGAGRVGLAHNAVDQVAHEAARTAALAGGAEQARTAARDTAITQLAAQGLECATLDVVVDTSGFAVPVGTPAEVEVTIVCTVPLSDLVIPGAPGSSTLRASASRALDTFRERT